MRGRPFVLDCIASGTIWVDSTNAPSTCDQRTQKGWSASPCCALVMLSARALERIEQTQSSSFACDLKKWLQIMQAYEQGGHPTMRPCQRCPRAVHDVMKRRKSTVSTKFATSNRPGGPVPPC